MRHIQDLFNLAEQVVGIEYSILGNSLESVGPMGANVAVRSDKYPDAPKETPHPADRERAYRLGIVVGKSLSDYKVSA